MTIKLVVSDVDGTIVRTDKSVAASTVAAAGRLREAGLPLSIVSARPPRGMAYITEALGLTGPLAGFNGGRVLAPDGTILSEHAVPETAARETLAFFESKGLFVFLFSGDDWLIGAPDGPHVAHEAHTVRFDPVVVGSFEPYLGSVLKMVGVSDDAGLLAAAEAELQERLGDRATAKRSQTYYLDLTATEANKGNAIRLLADGQGIDVSQIAVIGDMENDVPMFTTAGFSVAMGNASDGVKARASASTAADNDGGGWAEAVELILAQR
ncbi:MAG: HAD family hydrolase [Acetobacteraceae bacterium]|nr:HAD family hydrolase [Acetobacteraceae bacterium]